MIFGWNNKYTMLIMRSGKRHMTEGVELANQEKIRTLGERETYKYMKILVADTIKQAEMKEKIKVDLKGTKNLLETEFLWRNTWVVPFVRYWEPFSKWNREKLQEMDSRTRKLMTIHKALHVRDDLPPITKTIQVRRTRHAGEAGTNS